MSIPIKDVADSIVGSIFDETSGIIDNHSILAKAAAFRGKDSKAEGSQSDWDQKSEL